MATLKSLTKMFTVENKSKFISCSNDKNPDCVVFTFNDNSQVHNVAERRAVDFYKGKQSTEKFTSNVTYNGDSEEYVAVVNSKVLKVYTDYSKAQSYTLDTNVFKVEYVKKLNKCFVLFQNGEVEPLDNILEDPKVTAPFDEKPILQSFLVGTKIYFIANGEECLLLNVVDLTDNASDSLKSYELKYVKKLVSCCMMSSNKLVTLWSDGQLCTSDLPENHHDEIMFKLVTTFKNENFYSDFDHKVAALSSDVVAILHPESDESNNVCVSCVDLVYGSITKCNLKEINSRLCKDSKLVQVETDGKPNLFLINPNRVDLVNFKAASKVTLSSLLTLNIQENNLEFADDPFYASCSAEIKQHLGLLTAKVASDKNLKNSWKKLFGLLNESSKFQFFYSKTIMSALVESLIKKASKQRGAFEVLKCIISTKLLSTRVVPNLHGEILKMADKQTSKELHKMYLNHVNNISESEIVKSIDHCVEGEKYDPAMLEKLLYLRYTDNHLKYALTKLPYEKAMVVLGYVCKIFENCNPANKDKVGPALSWLCAIMDAHCYNIWTKVEASADVMKRLQKINAHVSKGYCEMEKLNREMAVVQNRSKVKEDNPKPSFFYSLDILDDEVDF